jgi:hypothetical protein
MGKSGVRFVAADTRRVGELWASGDVRHGAFDPGQMAEEIRDQVAMEG